jgi:hypothetical protein
MTNSLTKTLFKLDAKNVVEEAYRGLLERDADAEGSMGYIQSLRKHGDLPAILKDLAGSEERWKLVLSRHANKLMNQVFQGLAYEQGSAPGPAEYASTLAKGHDFAPVLAELVSRGDFIDQYVTQHGAQLATKVLTALLGHQPSEDLLHLYQESFSGSGGLQKALENVTATQEFWNTSFHRHGNDIARLVHTGLFQHEPDEKTASDYAADLSRPSDLASLLQRVVDSQAFHAMYWSRMGPDIVNALYRAVLARDPTEHELHSVTTRLRQPSDLTEVLCELLSSDHALNSALNRHARKIVDAVFQGLLKRDPDAQGYQSYADSIHDIDSFRRTISDVGHSSEFRSKWLEQLRGDIISATYSSLLGREPSDTEVDESTNSLLPELNLKNLLTQIIASEEFKESQFSAHRSKIVEQIYTGVLNRKADPAGLSMHTKKLSSPGEIAPVLRSFIASEEFQHTSRKSWRDPAERFKDPTYVFLHIKKSAGTSLRRMLEETWGTKVYMQDAEQIYQLSAGELANYSMICGHYDHDSLRYIPKENIFSFTFLRDPRERLMSFYHYFKAHSAGHPRLARIHQLADDLAIDDFFEDSVVLQDSGIWNHMTWTVMGAQTWSSWRKNLLHDGDESRRQQFILEVAKPAIEERLNQFFFIGLQEDYENSVNNLFSLLKASKPEKIRRENALNDLIGSHDNFKKSLDKQDPTDRGEIAINRANEIDAVLYQVGSDIYRKKFISHAG